MNKITSPAIIVLLLLSLFGCKNDDDILPEISFTENGSYFPSNIGNIWIYDDESDEKDTTKIIGTRNIDNVDYKVLLQDNDTTLFRYEKGKYYYKTTNNNPQTSITNSETKFLDENAEINCSWIANKAVFSDSTSTVTSLLKSKIIDKSGTVTVNGKTYNDIIVVETKTTTTYTLSESYIEYLQTLGITIDFPEILSTTQLLYYSKEIGLVKTSVTSNNDSFKPNELDLVSYTLN